MKFYLLPSHKNMLLVWSNVGPRQLEEEARRAQGGLGDPHGGAVRGIDGAAIVMTIARTYLPLRLNTTH